MSQTSRRQQSEPWTPERVCGLLIAVCRGRGLFGWTAGDLERSLNWRRRFLAGDPEGWSYLVAWAQAQAGTGLPATELIEARGFRRRAFETGWRRAAAAIAAGLAREAEPGAAMTDAGDAGPGEPVPARPGARLSRRRRRGRPARVRPDGDAPRRIE